MNNALGLAAVAALLAFGALPALAIKPGDWARYEVISSREEDSPPITRLTLTALDGPAGKAAWRMDVEKPEGERFRVWCVSGRHPLNPDCTPVGKVDRYLFQQGDGPVLDYRDAHSGGALLPRQPLEGVLLPVPLPQTRIGWPQGFIAGGTFLGHALARSAAGSDAPGQLPANALTLELDATLTVGTSRNFKDNGMPPPAPDVNWEFVPLTGEDFDRLIAAGHNYFIPTAEQLRLIINRPVFFVVHLEASEETRYPELLYRSNWWGTDSFYDEPAVRFGWSPPPGGDVTTPESIAHAITLRAQALAQSGPDSGIRALERYLRARKIGLGVLELREPDTPVWETMSDSACYQMMGGAHALIHEGRYAVREIEDLAGWLLGKGLSATEDEELRLHFACLRGAARVFEGEWGTAIYGQCDPGLRQKALNLAYDMGASYLWFWTSDHTHHVPFADQVALADGLTRHRRSRPARDMKALANGADTAIVLPFGYTLAPSPWWQQAMRTSFTNPSGVPYRSVPAAALFEFLTAMRSGADADIVVDHERLRDAGYKTLVYIRPDGTVELRGPGRRVKAVPGDTTKGTIAVAQSAEQDIPKPPNGVRAHACADFAAKRPAVDGSLDDWDAVEWIPMDQTVYGTPPRSDRDCSGAVATGCDGEFFYIAARVKDDRHATPGSGWSLWNGDCLQFALDPLGQRNSGGYDSDDTEIGFALTAGGPRAYRWESPGASPARATSPGGLDAGPIDGLDLAIVRNDAEGETRYEAAIPLSRLWPTAVRLGSWIGFNAVVNDADDGERVRAIGVRRGIAGPKSPAEFVVLTLPAHPAPSGISCALGIEKNVMTEAESGRIAVSAQVLADSPCAVSLTAEGRDRQGQRIASWAPVQDVGLTSGLQQLAIDLRGAALQQGEYLLEVAIKAVQSQPHMERFRLWILPPPAPVRTRQGG